MSINDALGGFKINAENKKGVLIASVVLVIILAILYWTQAISIPFKKFNQSDVLAILTSIFVVSIFMERSIEALLVPIRATGRQQIEQRIEDLERLVQTDPNMEQELLLERRNLADYRLKTGQIALWMSFAFGLLISAVGVRTLASLVDADTYSSLGDLQRTFFSFVDIILTGGVIAGGSAAIDKIGRTISQFFQLRSAISENPTVPPKQ